MRNWIYLLPQRILIFSLILVVCSLFVGLDLVLSYVLGVTLIAWTLRYYPFPILNSLLRLTKCHTNHSKGNVYETFEVNKELFLGTTVQK